MTTLLYYMGSSTLAQVGSGNFSTSLFTQVYKWAIGNTLLGSLLCRELLKLQGGWEREKE